MCNTYLLNTCHLAAYQASFAQAIRGRRNKPGTRINLYKKLIYANVFNFLDACFPVCRSILKGRVWRQLCTAFMREHVCQSPLFHQIPLEFISWLQTPNRFHHALEPAFLIHLAHYEYVELQIQTAPDITRSFCSPNSAIIITPLQLACYPYAVHTIGNENLQVPLATTWLLIWRKPDGSAGFAQVSPTIYRLMEQLQHSEDLETLFLNWKKTCTPTPNADQFVQALSDLTDLGIVQVNH